MSNSRVAVVGANGKTGRAVMAALEARGAQVSGIGRREEADLPRALAGCDAVYLMAPNMYADEPVFVQMVLDAAQSSGVGHVVYHSVASPYAPSMPHHLGKAEAEDLVRRGGAPWTILQPCAYVQNFVPALAGPAPQIRVAYDPTRRFGLVDLQDVAEAAATVLLERGHMGATYELGGPGLVSVEDVAAAAADVLGKPVPVTRVSLEQWRETDGAELDSRVVDWLGAMFAYYDDHGLPAGAVPLGALLGRTPTPLPITLARELC